MTTIAAIKHAVTAHYGLEATDLDSHRGGAAISRPRQVAMYLARRMTTASLPSIGYHLGRRDHSTIIHGVRRIDALKSTDRKLGNAIRKIERSLVAKDSAALDAALTGWAA